MSIGTIPLSDAATVTAVTRTIPGLAGDERRLQVTGERHALQAVAELLQWPRAARFAAPPLSSFTLDSPKLFPFQRTGAAFLRENLASGAACFDDMGLGKTVQAIEALSPKIPGLRVVLCPAFLRPQWKQEILRWHELLGRETPRVAVLQPPSSRTKRNAQLLSQLQEGDWLVSGYLDAEHLYPVIGYKPAVLVMDEVHNLRGMNTKRVDAVRGAAQFALGRIALTASELPNNGAKLFPMLDVIQPGAWGNFYAFTARYASGRKGDFGWTTGELSHVDELRRRQAHMSFRRVRQDVFDQLPFEASWQAVYVDAPGARSALDAVMAKGIEIVKYADTLARLKHPAVLAAVKNDLAQGFGVLTFTFKKSHAEKLAGAFPGALAVHGGLYSPTQRLPAIAQYVEQRRLQALPPVVFATIDSIGEGANLQWAKTVNFASLDLTPDRLRQAFARAARLGNTGQVVGRLFVARGTTDEYTADVLLRKLREQRALAGREEPDKESLHRALAVDQHHVEEVLRRMWEAAQAAGDEE